MQNHPVKFHGSGSEYFGIWIVNILLTILTLGIYSAWAKVRTKRYFYGNTEIDGDRFNYLATPVQILIGRIIAVVLLGIWFLAGQVDPGIATGLILLFAAIFPVLMVRNLRFDMRMTRYRNVRFDFVGGYGVAYKVFLLFPILAYGSFVAAVAALLFLATIEPVVVTVLATPLVLLGIPALMAWVLKNIAGFIINYTRFGNLKFSGHPETKVYFKITLKTMSLSVLLSLLVLAVVAGLAFVLVESPQALLAMEPEEAMTAGFFVFFIGVYGIFLILGFVTYAYYTAQIRNYLFSCTQINDQVQLCSNMQTWSFTWLIFSNLLLVLFTLGLARPWAAVRIAQYYAAATSLQGDLGFDGALDSGTGQQSAIADEVTQAFDFDVGVI